MRLPLNVINWQSNRTINQFHRSAGIVRLNPSTVRPQINPNQIKANFVRTKRCNLLGSSAALVFGCYPLVFLSPVHQSCLIEAMANMVSYSFCTVFTFVFNSLFFSSGESLSRWAQTLITNLLLRYLITLGFRWATESSSKTRHWIAFLRRVLLTPAK